MSATEIVIRLVAGVLLVGVNAFFVVTEFALTRLRQFSESEIEEDEGLRLAWKMTERLEIYLTGCQLGISASSILLGVIAEPAMTWLIRPAAELVGLQGGALTTTSVVVSVVVINLVHKVWGEQAPTYLGVERPLRVLPLTAPVLYWWNRIMYPVIIAGDSVAKWTLRWFGVRIERSWTEPGEGERAEEEVTGRADVRRAMGDVLVRGHVSRDRRREVMKALDIGDIPVREIMVPRDEIRAVRLDGDPAAELRRVSHRALTRVPLIGEALDDFRGIVYLPAALAAMEALAEGRVSLQELAVQPMTVDASVPVSELIDRFQEAEQELALVQEDGRVVGLVTTTDAFEAIVGDLRDPFDREDG